MDATGQNIATSYPFLKTLEKRFMDADNPGFFALAHDVKLSEVNFDVLRSQITQFRAPKARVDKRQKDEFKFSI